MPRSPFPEDFLGVDLYYADGWQPLGDDLDKSGVKISHGARSEGGTAAASSLGFTVTNSDGQYSPRNPASPLYGLVGLNTPARARVDLGATWLDLETPGARATTPDSVGLDITGDIDIRWWGYRDAWTAADLISKYDNTGNQRSFLLAANTDRTVTLFWSADGVSNLSARSLGTIPAWAGEIALRVTLDVNNGSGGRTARFYYATDLGGEWVQMGPEVTASGTTSIFASTAVLTLGKNPSSSSPEPPQRVYGWYVQAVGSTVRSSGTTSDLTPGATAFVDGTGRTWTVTDGSVSNSHTLAVCEVAEWPADWNTKGAPSVKTAVQASGVTRRLGQGAQAVESVLYRTITGDTEGMVGYWPLEDGADASSFGAAIGSRDAAKGPDVTPAAYADFPGSAPIPTFGDSRIRAEVDTQAVTGDVQVRWVQWTPDAALSVEHLPLARIEFVSGTVGYVELRLQNSTGYLGVFGYDFDDNLMGGSTYFSSTTLKGTLNRLSIELEKDSVSGDLDFRYVKYAPGDTLGRTGSSTFTFPHTPGRVRRIILNPDYRDMGDIAMGHLTFENAITSMFDVSAGPLSGFTGEQAGSRMLRLARENGTELTLRGRWSTPTGEQQEEALLDLLTEAAKADGGILHDDPQRIGLRYRTLDALGDQPAVVIPYEDNKVIPFKPTDDDNLTRNRVTIARPNGTRITHERTDGPLSVQTIGLYDESVVLNLNTDDLVDRTASWRLHVGTWDEGRYPTLGIDLADPRILSDPLLVRELLSLTVGDRLVIDDPPPWLPPRSVDVIVRGIQIDVTPLHIRLRWTCVPARPYRIGYWNAGHRYSGGGTVLASGVTTTATTLPLTAPIGVAWTHADGDYDITVGGEVMTVTDAWTDGVHLVVTRSVNGVTKTHAAGAAVELADPSFYAR